MGIYMWFKIIMSENINKESKDYMNENENSKKLSITNNEKIKKARTKCLLIILVLASLIIFICLFLIKKIIGIIKMK